MQLSAKSHGGPQCPAVRIKSDRQLTSRTVRRCDTGRHSALRACPRWFAPDSASEGRRLLRRRRAAPCKQKARHELKLRQSAGLMGVAKLGRFPKKWKKVTPAVFQKEMTRKHANRNSPQVERKLPKILALSRSLSMLSTIFARSRFVKHRCWPFESTHNFLTSAVPTAKVQTAERCGAIDRFKTRSPGDWSAVHWH